MHSHNCDEQVTILEGSAEFVAGERRELLGPLDTTYLPANLPHRFINCGAGPLRILWVYAGSAVTRTFTDSGRTVPHLSAGDKVR